MSAEPGDTIEIHGECAIAYVSMNSPAGLLHNEPDYTGMCKDCIGKMLRDRKETEAMLAETREEQIARWERYGWLDPTCPTCVENIYESAKMPTAIMMPQHKANDKCESGKRSHCTCAACGWD